MLLAFWLAAVVAATGVGVVAVRLVARQVGDRAVPALSPDDVRRVLSSASPTSSAAPLHSATPTGLPTPPVASPHSSSPTRAFSTTGGSVGVRCLGTTPQRVYWTPAQGWVLDESATEGSVLEVRFRQGRTRSRLSISCSSGAPVVVGQRVDSRGGGRG